MSKKEFIRHMYKAGEYSLHSALYMMEALGVERREAEVYLNSPETV